MTQRRLSRRRWSKGKRAIAWSQRSGCPFPYTEMITEPGTGLRIHVSENDGRYNLADVFKDPIVPPDAQQLQYPLGPPSDGNAPLSNFFWLGNNADEPLYVDGRKQDTMNTEDIV